MSAVCDHTSHHKPIRLTRNSIPGILRPYSRAQRMMGVKHTLSNNWARVCGCMRFSSHQFDRCANAVLFVIIGLIAANEFFRSFQYRIVLCRIVSYIISNHYIVWYYNGRKRDVTAPKKLR